MRAFVKYIPLLSLIIVIVTLPEVGMCQTAVDIETAVLPLPANLQSDASVMTYTAKGTLRIIRLGTNGFFALRIFPMINASPLNVIRNPCVHTSSGVGNCRLPKLELCGTAC